MRRLVLGVALALAAMAAPALAWEEPASEQQIAQRLADSLTSSGKLKGFSIGVKYKDGVARLEGWVRNEEQMQQALELVNSDSDVVQVVNNLSIRHEATVTRAAPGKPAAFRETEAAPLASQTQPSEEGVQHLVGQISQPESSQLQATAYPAQRMASRGSRPGFLPRGTGARAPQAAQNAAPQAQQQQFQQQQFQQVPQYVANVPPQYMAARQPGVVPPGNNRPLPAYQPGTGGGPAAAVYDQPSMPNYAWPSYAAYPNYGQVSYPKQYSPAAFPYIGPFYPYPQVPLGWRKVTLEWDDGWWFLNFQDDRLHVGHNNLGHRWLQHWGQ